MTFVKEVFQQLKEQEKKEVLNAFEVIKESNMKCWVGQADMIAMVLEDFKRCCEITELVFVGEDDKALSLYDLQDTAVRGMILQVYEDQIPNSSQRPIYQFGIEGDILKVFSSNENTQIWVKPEHVDDLIQTLIEAKKTLKTENQDRA